MIKQLTPTFFFCSALALSASSTLVCAQPKPLQIDRIVAIVNDEAISANEVQIRVDVAEKQIKKQNQGVPPRDVLAKQILERLITDRALMQTARDQGIRVDEATVDRAMERIATENKISLSALRDRVERDGMRFNRFREDIREEIINTRLREREVDAKITVSEAEVDRFFAEQVGTNDSSEYNVAQILLRLSENATAEQVQRQRLRGEEIIRQLQKGGEFARLSAAFSEAPEALTGGAMGWRTSERLPQLFVEALSKLRPDEVSGLLRSPNGFHVIKLVDKRSAGIAKLGGPVPQTKANHILIRVTDSVSESDVMTRINDIRDRLERGLVKFSDMAKQYSADSTASQGGDLGWILPGDTVPDFEREMDATAVGAISKPVRTQFGVHLIQVIERGLRDTPEERVRQQAKNAIRDRKSEQLYQEWVQQVRDKAYVELRNDES
jgi:peptidyl-prolyl cis-trans isomerase SurA